MTILSMGWFFIFVITLINGILLFENIREPLAYQTDRKSNLFFTNVFTLFILMTGIVASKFVIQNKLYEQNSKTKNDARLTSIDYSFFNARLLGHGWR